MRDVLESTAFGLIIFSFIAFVGASIFGTVALLATGHYVWAGAIVVPWILFLSYLIGEDTK